MLPNRETFEEWVKDYLICYDDPTNNNNMVEYVEGLVPDSYYQIWKEFNDMSLEINESHVGMEIWQVMRAHLFDEYYPIFNEVYEELTAYD